MNKKTEKGKFMKTKAVQKWLCGVGTFVVCCMLVGCHINHEWQDATCITPKTCSVGGETEGEALGHMWVDATCIEPKMCSVCGEKEGKALGHTLTEANYQQAATCEACGKTFGKPLSAVWKEEDCATELDKSYPYTVPCYENENYTTTGTVTFSDYEVFSSDAIHEALEGYEWKTVTVTYVFDDENAQKYGTTSNFDTSDYYIGGIKHTLDENFKLSYNGIDYTECMEEWEAWRGGWEGDAYIVKRRMFVRLPKGYDGYIAVAYSDYDAICYRLK